MLNRVRKTIKRFNMLSHGETVVVGVSGGSDSVGLLYVLAELEEYGLKLIVSHLNHRIRADEGKRDAAFVEGIAKRLNLAYEIQNADTPGFKEKSNLSLEEAARVLRYRFFKEVMRKHRAQKIATGHTLDDRAETVLMRIIRGSGTLGLSGIPPVSEGCIIRPLIETPKSEIEEYLNTNGVGWIEDSTNRAKVFLRNRIRHELVPELEKYNPRIKETLARTGELLRTQEDFIRSRANNWVEYVFKSVGEDELIGKVSNYRAIPEALRFAFLRIAIEKIKGDLRGVSFKHISSVDELLTSETPSGRISLPDEIIVAKGYDLFLVTGKSKLEQEFSYTVGSTGKWNFPYAEFEIEDAEVQSLGNGDEFTAFFDPDLVTFPIEIRSFRGGDRFIPLGMSKFKKIKRFFIDEKVPRFLRNRIPVFLTGGEIMWVGGMRIDERFKVKGKRAVRIRLIRPKWN
ncbi:MAG TPA: tRNA lysidine(34) synthetase TilS [Thermodesulfobacteriota bacterium]|nr:tRNA lysidine(34) synthetase TilS [Thermodesulfobacteriota bacterium]